MRIKRRRQPVRLGLLAIAMVPLAGGCTPLDAGGLEVFFHDLFLSGLAAFLL